MPEIPQEPVGNVATPAGRRRRQRWLFVLCIAAILELAGWLGDYCLDYRPRLLDKLAMLRLDNEPIGVVSKSPSRTGLWLRDSSDAPVSNEPFVFGGRVIPNAGPLGYRHRQVSPETVPGGPGHRVFIVGGSAAYGYPYRYNECFAADLNRRLSSRDLVVLNAAHVGYNSGEIAPIARRISEDYSAQTLIIFAGNNEWNHWQPYRLQGQAREASLATLRVLAHSRAVSAVEHILLDWLERPGATQGGVETFRFHYELSGINYSLQHPIDQLRFDPTTWSATKQHYLETFASNLRYMVTHAQDNGVRVIMLTIPFKYRLSPAWKHPQPDSFDPRHSVEVRLAISHAVESIAEGKYDQALQVVRDALKLDPLPPVLHYLAGQCLEASGDFAGARAAYAQCCETMIGALGSRLSINHVIRQVAGDTGAELLDVRELFDRYERSAGEHFNSSLIHDDCHPTPRGHGVIADALLPFFIESDG